MRENEKIVLTREKIEEDIRRDIKGDMISRGITIGIMWLGGALIIGLWLGGLDSIRPQYQPLFISIAVALILIFVGLAAMLILPQCKNAYFLSRGEYDIFEDTLVSVRYCPNPKGPSVSHLYFDHHGEFTRCGNCENYCYGMTFILVVYRDTKGTLAELYSAEKYRLDEREAKNE